MSDGSSVATVSESQAIRPLLSQLPTYEPVATLVRCADAAETVPYGLAVWFVKQYGLLTEFVMDYGHPANWHDSETGKSLGIDVCELIGWLESH